MTHAYSPREGAPKYTVESYDDGLKRLQTSPRHGYETVEVPAELQGNELGIIYKHPHEPKTERALILVKGLMSSRGAYTRLQSVLADMGYPVITYKSPRNQDLREAVKYGHVKNPLIFQSQGLRKIMQAVHESDDVKRVRGGSAVTEFSEAGHSMGTPISVMSAYHERVRKPNGVTTVDKVISIGGAGQNHMGFFSHAVSLGGLSLEVMMHSFAMQNNAEDGFMFDAFEHVAKSWSRIGREALHVAGHAYSMDMVDEMRENNMPFGAIILNSDGAFNPNKLEESLKGHVDFMRRVDGPHVMPNSDPVKFAPHLAYAIDELDHTRSVVPNLRPVSLPGASAKDSE